MKGLSKQEMLWVNKHVSMHPYLEQLTGEKVHGKIYCPFHDNQNTPAAKYFEDSNELYCFAEQKKYRVVDAMEKLGYTVEDVRARIPDEFKSKAQSFKGDTFIPKIPVVTREDREAFLDRSTDVPHFKTLEFMCYLASRWKRMQAGDESIDVIVLD